MSVQNMNVIMNLINVRYVRNMYVNAAGTATDDRGRRPVLCGTATARDVLNAKSHVHLFFRETRQIARELILAST